MAAKAKNAELTKVFIEAFCGVLRRWSLKVLNF